MYITILNEGNSVPPKMNKQLSDYLVRRCKIHPHKVKINAKLAQKYKNKNLDQNNSSSESPEITPEEIESVKRLVIVSVKLLVANWINKFVDAKLNEYTVNTMTRYKTNKVLYDYIRNQIDQVYIKHPNYRKCSVEQFKKESIWNYLLSEFRDKSKKEIANELAWYGVDEVILFACSEFIPLPGSVVLAVPVKMGLSYVGCKFGNALYELPFEFDGNMITVGLSFSPAGFVLSHMKLYVFREDNQLVAINLKDPPKKIYELSLQEAKEVLRKYPDDTSLEDIKQEVRRINGR